MMSSHVKSLRVSRFPTILLNVRWDAKNHEQLLFSMSVRLVWSVMRST